MLSMLAALIGVCAAMLACGAMYQWRGTRRDAQRLPPPGRLIDIGGRRLHLHCLGDARVPVVFEAGLAASSLNWRTLQEQVAPFARGCAYDRAGYGWSDRARGTRSARAAAADLHRLLQAAGVPPPYVLVAHSFGTYVARVFAAEHASQVAGLVLLDPITAAEWLAPDREHRRRLIGGCLVSYVGAALASIGVVRFLLNRLRAGGASSPSAVSPGAASPGAASSRAVSRRSALPAAVLRLFGHEVDAVVRRMIDEVAKMPRAVWPEVQAHWSRARSFLTMAQHFRALPLSAAEVEAATSECASDGRHHLHEMPMVVISAANCPEERVRGQRLLADLSRCGTHLRATIGGHWIHLDEPPLVIDAIRRVVDAYRDPAPLQRVER